MAIVGIIQNLLLSHYSNSHPQALTSHIIQNLLPSHYSKAPLHALSSPIIQNLPPHIIQKRPLSRYSNRLSVHYFDSSASPSLDQIFFTSLAFKLSPPTIRSRLGALKKKLPKCPFPNWKLDPPIPETPDLFSFDDASLLRPCLATLFHQLTFRNIRK